MLRTNFPSHHKGAELYGGFLISPGVFGKIFQQNSQFGDVLNSINDFLLENGYEKIESDETNQHHFDKAPVSLSEHGSKHEVILRIERESHTNDCIEFITNRLLKFRDERDWKQFHNGKDLALALSVESAELLELFMWKDADSVNEDHLRDELADVLSYSFLILEKYGWNAEEIILEKLKKNVEKYPAEKFRGNANKYNDLK